MIVKDYYEGKTHIIIDDKYCVKTQEEVDAILKAMGELVGRQLAQQQARRAAGAQGHHLLRVSFGIRAGAGVISASSINITEKEIHNEAFRPVPRRPKG